MKSRTCIVALCFLLGLHCGAPKSLPSEENSTATQLANEQITLTTTEAANRTETTTLPPVSSVAPHNPLPSSLIPNSVQNFVKNVGYALRIVMKMLAPLLADSQKTPPPEMARTPAGYDDFDDLGVAEEEAEGSRQVLQNSFLRVVRQVAEEGRQGLSGYYDFAVNEYSYKFWAVYMLFASGLLIYSAIAAIYYAKFNTNAIDYAQYDEARDLSGPGFEPLGLKGSLLSLRTFQTIMEAIASPNKLFN